MDIEIINKQKIIDEIKKNKIKFDDIFGELLKMTESIGDLCLEQNNIVKELHKIAKIFHDRCENN